MLTLVGEKAGTNLQHLVQAEVSLQSDVEAVVLHSLHVTLLVVVTCRHIVVGIVAAAAHTGVVLLIEHVAEENIVPIGVDGAETVDALLSLGREGIPTTCLVSVELAQFVEDVRHPTLVLTVVVTALQKSKFKIDLLIGIEQMETVDAGAGTVGEFGGKVHDGAPNLSLLSGDDNDAVGGTRTIDGSGGGILQHGDVVDVSRIETCDAGLVDVVYVIEIFDGGNLIALHRNAVEHPEGFLHSVDGGGSTNAYLGWCTRCTCGRHRRKTCHQCLVDVLDGTNRLVADFHFGNGGGEFAAVNLLITRDNNLAKTLGGSVQRHVILVLIGLQGDGLGFITHITDGYLLDGGKDGEGEMAVHIGHSAFGGAFTHGDVCTDKWFSLELTVHHGACDGTFLCHHRKDGNRHHQQEHQKSFHIHHIILYYILSSPTLSSISSTLSIILSPSMASFFICSVPAPSGCATPCHRNASVWQCHRCLPCSCRDGECGAVRHASG